MKYKRLVFIVILLCVSLGQAKDIYQFKTNAQRERFHSLLKEFRCLVCQNQDLADSNAELAKDLKLIIYKRMLANQSNKEIREFLTERYGDFILFNPPIKGQTLALWFVPLLALVLGLTLLFSTIIKRKNV